MRRTILAAAGFLLAVPSSYAQNVWRVGIIAAPPFSAIADAASNKAEGAMVELMDLIAADNGATVQYVLTPAPEIGQGLVESRYDIIGTAYLVTPERFAQFAWSEPTFFYGEGIMVPRTNTTDYVTWEDMRGLKVGVLANAAWDKPLRDSGLFAEVRSYPAVYPDVTNAVIDGTVDVGFGNAVTNSYRLNVLGLYPELRVGSGYASRFEAYTGFVMRKEDTALLEQVQASLAEIREYGTLGSIAGKWGMLEFVDP